MLNAEDQGLGFRDLGFSIVSEYCRSHKRCWGGVSSLGCTWRSMVLITYLVTVVIT